MKYFDSYVLAKKTRGLVARTAVIKKAQRRLGANKKETRLGLPTTGTFPARDFPLFTTKAEVWCQSEMQLTVTHS